MKRLLFKVFAVIIGVACAYGFTLLIEEIVDIYTHSHGYFQAMPPGVTKVFDTSEFTVVATISAQGLRNREVAMPKPSGTYRILALGDSFTFGWGVEEDSAWPQVLEQKLRENGKHVEIINAGMPGASPTYERYICRAYERRFDVDAVIVGIHTDDLYQAAANTISVGIPERVIKDNWPVLSRIGMPILDLTMLEESKKYVPIRTTPIWEEYVKGWLSREPDTLARVAPELRTDYVAGKINPALIKWAMIAPDYYTYILEPGYLSTALKALRDKLQKLKTRCTKDLPVMVAFLPGTSMISDAYLENKAKLGFNINAALTSFDMDSQLVPIVENYGFYYISPLSLYRSDGCPDCYYPIDGHPTKIGYGKIAQFIFEHLSPILPK